MSCWTLFSRSTKANSLAYTGGTGIKSRHYLERVALHHKMFRGKLINLSSLLL